MSVEGSVRQRSAFCVVLGNEKGGSGKSTVAMHIAIALTKAGQRVATADLDARQKSFTSYIENRRAWAKHVGRDLEIPHHICLEEAAYSQTADDRATGCKALAAEIEALAESHDFIVIDT